jgi:hypothetical protein
VRLDTGAFSNLLFMATRLTWIQCHPTSSALIVTELALAIRIPDPFLCHDNLTLEQHDFTKVRGE